MACLSMIQYVTNRSSDEIALPQSFVVPWNLVQQGIHLAVSSHPSYCWSDYYVMTYVAEADWLLKRSGTLPRGRAVPAWMC